MKLWEEPQVYLVAQSGIRSKELYDFVSDSGFDSGMKLRELLQQEDLDAIPEVAGRVCYMSWENGRPSDDYLEHIKEVGHGSVLEHSSISIIVTGISRTATHEMVRHRAGFAYSQLSQRYVDESCVGFVVPPLMLDDSKYNKDMFNKHLEGSLSMYKHITKQKLKQLATIPVMIKLGVLTGYIRVEKIDDCEDIYHLGENEVGVYDEIVEIINEDPQELLALKKATYSMRKKRALEAARSVLPNCTETKIMVTGNGRAWRHFLNMRGSEHADAEIRRLSCVVAEKLKGVAPLLFDDVTVKDGLVHVTNKKV